MIAIWIGKQPSIIYMQIKRSKNGFTICDFKIVDKYKYKDYTRNDEKIRTYNVDGQKFPSVTTILSATQSEEKRKALCNWRQRVGQEQATRITIDAARRGTEMHLVLEKVLSRQTLFQCNSTR